MNGSRRRRRRSELNSFTTSLNLCHFCFFSQTNGSAGEHLRKMIDCSHCVGVQSRLPNWPQCREGAKVWVARRDGRWLRSNLLLRGLQIHVEMEKLMRPSAAPSPPRPTAALLGGREERANCATHALEWRALTALKWPLAIVRFLRVTRHRCSHTHTMVAFTPTRSLLQIRECTHMGNCAAFGRQEGEINR